MTKTETRSKLQFKRVFLNNNLNEVSYYKYYLILKKLAHTFEYNLFFSNLQQHIIIAFRMEFAGCK